MTIQEVFVCNICGDQKGPDRMYQVRVNDTLTPSHICGGCRDAVLRSLQLLHVDYDIIHPGRDSDGPLGTINVYLPGLTYFEDQKEGLVLEAAYQANLTDELAAEQEADQEEEDPLGFDEPRPSDSKYQKLIVP